MTGQKVYRLWTWGISVFVVVLGGFLPLAAVISPYYAASILGGGGAIALYLLFMGIHRQDGALGHPLPHVLTAIRGIVAVALLILLSTRGAGSDFSDPQLWLLFSVLAVVETTDFLDGRLARYYGPTSFGALWDMENDAFFTFALTFSVWVIRDLPGYLLMIGLMRYAYFIVVHVQGDPPGYPGIYKLYAKSVAATLVMVLIAAVIPVVSREVVVIVLTGALVLQLVSFGWDFALHYLAGRTVGSHS